MEDGEASQRAHQGLLRAYPQIITLRAIALEVCVEVMSFTPQEGPHDPRGVLLLRELVGLNGLHLQELLVAGQNMSTRVRPLSGKDTPLRLLKTLSRMHP